MPTKRIYTNADLVGAADIITLIKSKTGDELYEDVYDPAFLHSVAQMIADARRRTAARYRQQLRDFHEGKTKTG